MSLLATLYENGFISYPRTDNRRFKDQFPHDPIIEKLKNYPHYDSLVKFVKDTSQVRTNGRKMGTEDHDPIHPTGEIPKEANKITKLHIKAWDYISRYYIGMFMPDLIQSRGFVRIQIEQELFSQKYQQTLDEGWTRAITWRKPKETNKFTFNIGDTVQVNNFKAISYETKPPPSWSDSKIIKQLEKLKIGTKSSRPEILKKLVMRNYIYRARNESTPLGQSIILMFEQIWPDVVTPSFTRMVEQQMDEVASKKAEFKDMLEGLRNHYIQLHKKLLSQLPELHKLLKKTSIHSSDQPIPSKSQTKYTKQLSKENPCPLCQEGVLLERFNSKTKQRFFGCSNYPKCNWTSPSRKTREGTYVPTLTSKNIVGPCPTCEGKLSLKKVKDYRLIGCSNYPTCKTSYFLPKKGRLIVLREKCPTCNRKRISHSVPKTAQSYPKKEVFCVVCLNK
jgi:DNA topoisomerase-1